MQITAAAQKQLALEFLANGCSDSRQALLEFMAADHRALSFAPSHQRQLFAWDPKSPATTIVVKEKELTDKRKKVLSRSQSVDLRSTTQLSTVPKQGVKSQDDDLRGKKG